VAQFSGVRSGGDCLAGSGYAAYGIPGDGAVEFWNLYDINQVCLSVVASGKTCFSDNTTGCQDNDLFAANGTTIYEYLEYTGDDSTLSGWYAIDPGYTGGDIKTLASSVYTGYDTYIHNLWILDTSNRLYNLTTVHGRFGWTWSIEQDGLAGGCNANDGVSLSEDTILCQGVGVFHWSGNNGWMSAWAGDPLGYYSGIYADYGFAQIAYSSHYNSLWLWSQGEYYNSSSAAIFVINNP
jgi:hypothetical protein